MITEDTARKQPETLHQEGSALAAVFAKEKEEESFEVGYQRWVRGMPQTPVQGKHGPGRPAKQDAQPGRWRSHPVSWCAQGAHP